MRSESNRQTLMATAAKQKIDFRTCDLGLAEYRNVHNLQLQLQARCYRNEIPNTVLVVEHQPVITLGAQKRANKLLVSKEELKRRAIDVVETRRGGGVTAHNPGQIVFYPILRLQQLNLGISEYVRKLEAIGSELLKQFCVKSKARKGYPGLWVGEKKIASIGVRVSRSVTYHGMAININNDLSIFDLLIPCGIDGVKITSVLKETGRIQKMSRVKEELWQLLRKSFSRKS